MKKTSFGKTTGLGGKGFYIALALSVAAVGTVTYLTLSQLNGLADGEGTSSAHLENLTSWSVPETSAVQKPQTGVPKDTPTVSEGLPSSSEAEASSEAETAAPVSEPASSPSSSAAGAFIMPISGEISCAFSNGELVKSKTLNEWRTHDGIDILAAEATPVKSVYDGSVTDIREDSKWGVVIEISYPGDITAVYAGLSKDVKVKKGQSVKLGDVIGTVGNTTIVESAEDSHLHLGMKKGGEWIDPLSILTVN